MSVEDQFAQYEGFLTIGMVHERLKDESITIPIPTLRNWVNELHQLQIHTLARNPRGERIFSQTDMQIVKFIYEAKKRFGNLTMPNIGNMIQEKFKGELFYNPNDDEQSDNSNSPALSEYHFREMLKNELAKIEQLKNEMIQAKQAYESQLALLPNPEDEKKLRREEMRTELHNTRMRERRVRQKLREQAIELWNQNPIKKGFLIKSEDTGAKALFIEDYIEKHFDEHLENERRKDGGGE